MGDELVFVNLEAEVGCPVRPRHDNDTCEPVTPNTGIFSKTQLDENANK
jgi:hypothetical protein